MPTTLSYGFKLPVDGDTAGGTSGWFDTLEFDITQLNSHDHDGTDSAAISGKFVTIGSTSAPSGSWGSAVSTGVYRQTVALPSGFTFDNVVIQVRITSTGEVVYPTIEKISSTSMYVYTGDNTVSYTVYFK